MSLVIYSCWVIFDQFKFRRNKKKKKMLLIKPKTLLDTLIKLLMMIIIIEFIIGLPQNLSVSKPQVPSLSIFLLYIENVSYLVHFVVLKALFSQFTDDDYRRGWSKIWCSVQGLFLLPLYKSIFLCQVFITEKNTRFTPPPPHHHAQQRDDERHCRLDFGSGFLTVKLPFLVRTLAELNAVKVVWQHVPFSSRHFASPCKALMRVACVTRLAPVQEGGPSLHPSLALIASFNLAECLHLPPMPLRYLLFLRVLLYLHYALCLLVCR